VTTIPIANPATIAAGAVQVGQGGRSPPPELDWTDGGGWPAGSGARASVSGGGALGIVSS
jgi:hypothetical protein